MSGKQYPPLSQTIENTPRKNYQYKGRVNSAANVQTSYQAQLNKDLLLLIDSNGRYIDANNLSDESNLSWSKQSCPTVESAINTIMNLNFRTEPETVICHTGTNDLASKNPLEAKNEIIDMIEIIRQKLPNTKVVRSVLLPRKDYLKQDTMKLNELIYRHINMMQNVLEFLKHDNISNSRRQVLYDTKHLNKFVGIPLLKQNFLSIVHPF